MYILHCILLVKEGRLHAHTQNIQGVLKDIETKDGPTKTEINNE